MACPEPVFDQSSLQAWERGLDTGTRARGAEEFAAGRVSRLEVGAECISGVVSAPGALPYRAVLSRHLRTGSWTARCDCPVGVSCKHAVAVALAALDAAGASPAAADAPAPEPAKTPFIGAAAEALGRELTRKEALTLMRVLDAYRARKAGESARTALEAVVFQLTGADFATANRLANELEEVSAESPEAMFAAVILTLQNAGKALPVWVHTVANRTGTGASLEREREARAVAEWRRRLASMSDADVPEVAREGTHELRLRRADPRFFRWQTREGAAAGWRDLTPAEISRWFRPGFEPRSEFTAEAAPVADLMRRAAVSPDRPAEFDLGRLREHGPALGDLLAHPRLRDLTVEADGRPLHRHEARLVWAFLPSLGKPGYARAELVRADGGPAAGPLHALGRRLWLGPDGLWRGPKPLEVGGDIPLAVFEDAAVARALKQAGAIVAPKASGELVAITPEVSATVSGELAVFTLRGLDASGRVRVVPAHNGWRSLAVDGVATGGVPDTARLDVARRHFLTGPGYDGDRLSVLLDERTVPVLAGWLSGFSSGVLFNLPPEIAALAKAPDRAVLAAELAQEREGADWFDLKLVMRAEDAELSKSDLKLLMAHAGQWVRVPGKGWRRLEASVTEASREAFASLGIDADAATGAEKLRFHAAQLEGARAESLFDEASLALLRARTGRETAPATLPKTLKAKLRPYQESGFRFLAGLSEQGVGGLLADDMGLGKTLQTIAWLLWLKERGKGAGATPVKFLVVAPKSVTGNWVAEAAKFAPTLRAVAYGEASSAALARAELIVANYARLRLDAEFFAETEWTAVVLDEGQHIKNPSSQVAEAARALKAANRLVLSGTPVENRLADLWSLYAFAAPGLLGAHASFRRHYDERKDSGASSRLAARVRPFLLRRTKAQVAPDLPERIEEDLVIDPEPKQKKLYAAELKKARALLLEAKTAKEFEQSRFHVLSSLLRLRQICCDPRLVSPKASPEDSAKLDALWELVEPLVAEGHKVLVFSQFTEVLGLIGEKLGAEGVSFLSLTGATENRAALVERFQRPDTEKVFLLSLKAAGSGLNLTAASYVVLFDPWWNPAAEAQAIDRTHRIGQKNKVIAYRLLVRGTVEEKIRSLQRDKAALAAGILGDGPESLDAATLRGLLDE